MFILIDTKKSAILREVCWKLGTCQLHWTWSPTTATFIWLHYVDIQESFNHSPSNPDFPYMVCYSNDGLLSSVNQLNFTSIFFCKFNMIQIFADAWFHKSWICTDTFNTLFSHLWELNLQNTLLAKLKKKKKKIPLEMESVCSIHTVLHFTVKYNKVKHPTWHQVTSQPAKIYLKGTLIEAQVKDKCMYIICDRGNTREMECLYSLYPLTDTHKTKSIDCILSSESGAESE